MTTALELIESAMGKLNLLAAAETVSPEDAAVCLKRLNAMIDAWEGENLFAYTTPDTTFNLTAGTTSRTIGTGQQIDLARPQKILRGSFVRLGPIDYPLEPVDEVTYNEICQKGIQSVVPRICFYDGGNPTGVVYFYPAPSSTVQVHLLTPEAGGAATDTSTAYIFPQGYQRAVEFNLAVEIAPDFRVAPSPMVAAMALSSKRALKRANLAVPELNMDMPLGTYGYDYEITSNV